MPSRIQELVQSYSSDKINFDEILERNKWLQSESMNCILSPDSDGLLSALLMSKYLNWNIVGFYDGKVLLLKNGISCFDEKTVFLDMEVFRSNVRSIGHHMVNYNKRLLNKTRELSKLFQNNYAQCVQPNLLREFDAKNNFRIKYPFGTVHLLLAILGSRLFNIKIHKEAICPLFFVAGTFNVLYSYPENVLNWLSYLRFDEGNNPLKELFQNDYTVFSLIIDMDKFFRKRDEISVTNERGDRLRISETDGSTYNITENERGLWDINDDAVDRISEFIRLLASLTGWDFDESKWYFSDFKLFQFTKVDFLKRNWRVNNQNFSKLLQLNPLSWAMTSGDNIEFTLEEPNKLF